MKNHAVQQEILLMPDSSFLRHQCYQKSEHASKKQLRLVSEEIEKACLSGAKIHKMISSIIENAQSNEKLFLLQARCEKEFFELELGEDYFNTINRSFSISPSYFFSNDMNN